MNNKWASMVIEVALIWKPRGIVAQLTSQSLDDYNLNANESNQRLKYHLNDSIYKYNLEEIRIILCMNNCKSMLTKTNQKTVKPAGKVATSSITSTKILFCYIL